HLPMSALDLQAGWAIYARAKTGVQRKSPLWPETLRAIQEWLSQRPEPARTEDAGRLFLTRYRRSYTASQTNNYVSRAFGKLLKKVGVNGRKGLNFYGLRCTFRTVGDESRDQPAVDHLMGHEPPTMASIYRQAISDERLRAVSDYVRAWLFG